MYCRYDMFELLNSDATCQYTVDEIWDFIYSQALCCTLRDLAWPTGNKC